MYIINCEIGFKNIKYMVLTDKGIGFTYELLKNTSSLQVRKSLRIVSDKIDNRHV